MNSTKELIEQAINNLDKDVPEKTKEQLMTVMTNILEKDQSPVEAMGIGQDLLDFSYRCAYDLFKAGNYNKASAVFTYLRTIDPLSYRYAYGLAACYHHLEDFAEAITLYSFCAGADTDNPDPCFYGANCLLSIQANNAAILLLKESIKRSEGKSKFNHTREVSEIILKKLEMNTSQNRGEKK